MKIPDCVLEGDCEIWETPKEQVRFLGAVGSPSLARGVVSHGSHLVEGRGAGPVSVFAVTRSCGRGSRGFGKETGSLPALRYRSCLREGQSPLLPCFSPARTPPRFSLRVICHCHDPGSCLNVSLPELLRCGIGPHLFFLPHSLKQAQIV